MNVLNIIRRMNEWPVNVQHTWIVQKVRHAKMENVQVQDCVQSMDAPVVVTMIVRRDQHAIVVVSAQRSYRG